MVKEKKERNPADAFRREQKKLQIKKAKVEKVKVQEVRSLLNDPQKIQDRITELQKESDQNKLDKSLKDKIKEMKEMHIIAVKKQKMSGSLPDKNVITSVRESSTSPIVSQSHGTTIPRRLDESVFYHPLYNPMAVPPPGQVQIYKPVSQPPPPPLGWSPYGPYQQPRPFLPIGGFNGPPPNHIRQIGGQNGIPMPPPPMSSNYGVRPIQQPTMTFVQVSLPYDDNYFFIFNY